MSKKSKNIILGLVIVFFASIALLFSENSSEIIKMQESSQEFVEDAVEEFKFSANKDEEPEAPEEEFIESEDNSTESILSVKTYKVVKVVDGDTIDVNINGKVERLRLIGIDTPETVDPRKPVECFGKEASKKTRELLFGKYVSLESDETQGERDKYGRLLRYVFLEDGTNFNNLMIREGYAHEYTYDEDYKYQLDFQNSEDEAIKNKNGLWSLDTCSGEK